MNRYGYDGQLGCAAITFTSDSGTGGKPTAVEEETVAQLEKWATTNESAALPSYAVPRFLRVLVSTETATKDAAADAEPDRVSPIMKKLKTGLRQEGESEPRSISIFVLGASAD
ncbi:hypothetical protein ABEF94_000686 [Exophiala dermatitidis]